MYYISVSVLNLQAFPSGWLMLILGLNSSACAPDPVFVMGSGLGNPRMD